MQLSFNHFDFVDVHKMMISAIDNNQLLNNVFHRFLNQRVCFFE